MKKGKIMNWAMLVLLLLSSLSTLTVFSGETATAQADITEKVTISGFEMQFGDGSPVTETDPIKLGDIIRIKYKWGVSREKMQGIQAGDSFTVDLPDHEYFGGYSDEGPYNLENPSGGPSLGTYELRGSSFIVTINEEGARQTELVNGWLSAHVKALKEGDGIYGGGNGSEAVPKMTIIDPGGGGGTSEDDEEFKDYDLPFYKTGNQITNTNSINWAFRVNYSGIKQMIDTYSLNGPGAKMSSRQNVLLIDHLAPGMKFQADSLFVTVPVFVVNSHGKMGTRVVKETNNLQVQDSFVRIEPHLGENYESFKERVRKSPSQSGYNTYGIYLDSENRETVLIAFGNLPGGYSYNDVHGGRIADAIQGDDSLSNEQKKQMLDIYCNPDTSPGNTGIVAYDLSFNVDVQVHDGYGEGKYSNQAELIWDDDQSESWETEVDFYDIGGLVQGEMIQADKVVEGTGEIKPPQLFEFEIVDASDPQTPVAYGKTVQPVATKGEHYEITFYRTKTAEGDYQDEIIGNDTTTGWKCVFLDGHSYYIREVAGSAYSVSFIGGLGEQQNRFDYNANINKVTQFLITNRPLIGLEAYKKVTGTADLTSPQTFSFELQNQKNEPVAYGKTVVEQKEQEYLIDFYSSADYEAATKITNWEKLLKDGEAYTLVETDAKNYLPEYYYKDSSGNWSAGATITADFETEKMLHFLVENQKEQVTPAQVSLNVQKQLEGRALKADEFEFELYDAAGNLLETQTNDEAGNVLFSKREFSEAGTYQFMILEKKGSEDHMTYDDKKVTAVIDIVEEDGRLVSTVTYEDDDQKDNTPELFINSYQQESEGKGGFLLEKIDIDSQEPLANAVFHLYDANNQRVKADEVIQTGPDGTIEVKNLAYGEYFIYEVTAPEGYQIEKEPEKIVINEENAKKENRVINRDPKIQEGITLTKLDSATDEKLQGAEFILYDSNGNQVDTGEELITDENGIIHIDRLAAGTYSMVETKAPKSYILDKTPLVFTVKEENKLIELTKKNKKTSTSIQTAYPITSQKTPAKSETATSLSTGKAYPATGSESNWFWKFIGLCLIGVLYYRGKKIIKDI